MPATAPARRAPPSSRCRRRFSSTSRWPPRICCSVSACATRVRHARRSASLETASRLNPALTAPREALAALYVAGGDVGRAIDQLEALVALDSSKATRLVALGLAYADAGRYEAAVLTLGRAIERFPDSPDAYAALGHVWLETAEARSDTVALNKALGALTTAASHSDATSETLTDFGRALMLGGDTAAAERALRQALAKLPVLPEAYLHLATITSGDGRLQDARDALVRYATLVGDQKPMAGTATRIASTRFSWANRTSPSAGSIVPWTRPARRRSCWRDWPTRACVPAISRARELRSTRD